MGSSEMERDVIDTRAADSAPEPATDSAAPDSTARGTAMAELEAMQSRPSQDAPGEEIPERSWFYRFVKKHWFNDFGTYANPRSIDEILGPEPANRASANRTSDR